jgi:hypothetical protein
VQHLAPVACHILAQRLELTLVVMDAAGAHTHRQGQIQVSKVSTEHSSANKVAAYTQMQPWQAYTVQATMLSMAWGQAW